MPRNGAAYIRFKEEWLNRNTEGQIHKRSKK